MVCLLHPYLTGGNFLMNRDAYFCGMRKVSLLCGHRDSRAPTALESQ